MPLPQSLQENIIHGFSMQGQITEHSVEPWHAILLAVVHI